MKQDLDLLDLKWEWALDRVMWSSLIWGKHLTLAIDWKMDIFKINDDDDDVDIQCLQCSDASDFYSSHSH